MSGSKLQVAEKSSQTITPVPVGLLQRKCACGNHTAGGSCGECTKEKMNLQRKSASQSELGKVPPIVHDVLRSSGQPLDAASRAFFEPRFGHDFSRVRVHTDARAAESARAVSALGYTVGRNIVCGAGQYRPHSPAGNEFLAHELTHVVQQGFGRSTGSGLAIGPAGDHAEREADAVSTRLANGAAAASGNSHVSPRLQRLQMNNPGFGKESSDSPAKEGRANLPYAQAKELAECMKIMGPDSSEYCREEVLGEKPPVRCPKTHDIQDDVYKAIAAAWAKSGHGGATVKEHGGRIVTDKQGKRVIRTGSGGGGSISLPAEKKGDTTEGTFHTHPYSAAEGSTLGVSFSGGDLNNFIAGGQGRVKYIGAGTCIFAVETLSSVDQDACKKNDTIKRWNDAFSGAAGTFQGKVETSVKAAIAGCGMCYYKACQKDAATPIPKTMDLVT